MLSIQLCSVGYSYLTVLIKVRYVGGMGLCVCVCVGMHICVCNHANENNYMSPSGVH